MNLKNNFIGKKSLFSKYTKVSILIVFFSFLVLGTILTLTISNYWSNEKLTVLGKRAENIGMFLKTKTAINDPIGGGSPSISLNDSQYLKNVLQLFADDSGVDIIVTNAQGLMYLTISDSITNYSYIRSDIFHEAKSKESYFSQGDLGGLYKEDRYIAAKPVKYSNGEKVMYVVFVTSSKSDVNSFTDMVLKIFILSAIASLGISFLAIGLFSYNLVKPLRQMAQAVKQFGSGEFGIRVSEATNDEIGELAVAFNNMADSLSAAESMRRSFIANVSHELKTPMTTIAGFIDGILDGTIPPEKHQYYLHIVSDEVKRLSRLVRSMLDLSRIDSGELKINYQNFDMLTTLVTIVITFEQEINKKNIEIRGLDVLTPTVVYGDKDLLHQVIYNLIENAVKFTNEGGIIEFTITDSLERTDFYIRNSGTGINKKELSLVFDKFYKTDKSRSKDKKGLGLGLYLVRSIIRLHGGDITAESEYGKYSLFHFYIPKRNAKGKKNTLKQIEVFRDSRQV